MYLFVLYPLLEDILGCRPALLHAYWHVLVNTDVQQRNHHLSTAWNTGLYFYWRWDHSAGSRDQSSRAVKLPQRRTTPWCGALKVRCETRLEVCIGCVLGIIANKVLLSMKYHRLARLSVHPPFKLFVPHPYFLRLPSYHTSTDVPQILNFLLSSHRPSRRANCW